MTFDYGLSIVLGTAEVTMEEIVKLYALFLNKGMLKPLKKNWTTHTVRVKPF